MTALVLEQTGLFCRFLVAVAVAVAVVATVVFGAGRQRERHLV